MPDLSLGLHLIPLFSALPENELAAVRIVLETHVVEAGTTVCRQGDTGKHLFIVADGGVRVLLSNEGGRRGELYFGSGSVFGELSLLSEMPVSATVIAARRTVLLTLDDAFAHLLETQPSLYVALTKMLVAHAGGSTPARRSLLRAAIGRRFLSARIAKKQRRKLRAGMVSSFQITAPKAGRRRLRARRSNRR